MYFIIDCLTTTLHVKYLEGPLAKALSAPQFPTAGPAEEKNWSGSLINIHYNDLPAHIIWGCSRSKMNNNMIFPKYLSHSCPTCPTSSAGPALLASRGCHSLCTITGLLCRSSNSVLTAQATAGTDSHWQNQCRPLPLRGGLSSYFWNQSSYSILC